MTHNFTFAHRLGCLKPTTASRAAQRDGQCLVFCLRDTSRKALNRALNRQTELTTPNLKPVDDGVSPQHSTLY